MPVTDPNPQDSVQEEEVSGFAAVLMQARVLEVRYAESRRLNRILTACVLLLVVSVTALSYFAFQVPKPQFMSVDPDGRLVQFLPLESPLRTVSDVRNFASEAMRCVQNIDSVNAKKQLDSCRTYFSGNYFAQYLGEVQKEGVVNALESLGTAIQTYEPNAPILTNEGVDPKTGAYIYQFEITGRQELEVGKQRRGINTTHVIRLQRVDVRKKFKGVEVIFLNDRTITNILS